MIYITWNIFLHVIKKNDLSFPRFFNKLKHIVMQMNLNEFLVLLEYSKAYCVTRYNCIENRSSFLLLCDMENKIKMLHMHDN